MAIRDSQGNVYKISGPNPLMKAQNFWDRKKITLINFAFGKSINQTIQNNYEVPIQIKEEIVEEPKITVPIKEEIPIRNTEVKPKKDDYLEKKTNKTSLFYCLPVVNQETSEYGNKFSFEGVVIDEGDIQFVFWTKLQLPKNSIIYSTVSRQWWKVDTLTPKNSGFFVMCNISSVSPDFS